MSLPHEEAQYWASPSLLTSPHCRAGSSLSPVFPHEAPPTGLCPLCQPACSHHSAVLGFTSPPVIIPRSVGTKKPRGLKLQPPAASHVLRHLLLGLHPRWPVTHLGSFKILQRLPTTLLANPNYPRGFSNLVPSPLKPPFPTSPSPCSLTSCRARMLLPCHKVPGLTPVPPTHWKTDYSRAPLSSGIQMAQSIPFPTHPIRACSET